MIQLDAVSKHYRSAVGPVHALDNISLQIERGSFTAVSGPSGCGKTTMLRLVAGFERLDYGEISIQGRKVSTRSEHEPPERRMVGMVIQEYALFPHLNVAQNVLFGLMKLPRDDRRARLAEVLELGIEEMLADGVCVVEWAEKAVNVLPRQHLLIEIEVIGLDDRRLRLTPHGEHYDRLLERVRSLAQAG